MASSARLAAPLVRPIGFTTPRASEIYRRRAGPLNNTTIQA